MLIGISGVTNGGKTTLSKRLIAAYPNSAYISQDKYYWSRESGKLEYRADLLSHNYDTIDAVDNERFLNDLRNLIDENKNDRKYDFIFVDGFLLFKLVTADNDFKFEKKFFFTLEKEECFEKRKARNYKTVGTRDYFEQLVWPCYSSYLKYCKDNFNDIVYLNGAQHREITFNFVKYQLEKLIKQL